jgi:hypothetical protein
MRHVNKLFIMILGYSLLAVVFAIAQDNPGDTNKTSGLEITDVHGTKHVVMNCENGSRFFDSGTPFDENEISGRSWSETMRRLIAVELHTPDEQAKITDKVDDFKDHKFSPVLGQTVLLVPISSIEDCTFTQQNIGGKIQISSVIRLAGGESFNGGGIFCKLSGNENLGPVGTSDFSANIKDIKKIRSLVPVPFVGDFAFFGESAAIPFSAKVTDKAGAVTVLRKTLYCFERSVPQSSGLTSSPTADEVTLGFKSDLDVTLASGSNFLSIPPSKLRKITVGDEVNGNFNAKAILRTGENYDLTIVPPNHKRPWPYGILGTSSRGWVWIPWFAVASVEFEDK